MKRIEPTGKEVWVLFYQWGVDSDPAWWAAYDSSEALFFDFDEAYRGITWDLEDEITDEEIAQVREELRYNAYAEASDLGLYMSVDRIMIYGFGKED